MPKTSSPTEKRVTPTPTCVDHAGHVPAQHDRRLELHDAAGAAGARLPVHRVDARGLHAHEHLGGDGLGRRQVDRLEHVGRAVGRSLDRLHKAPTASATGVEPLSSSKVLPTVLGASSTATSTAATSSRGICPRRPSRSEMSTDARARVVGQAARAHDRVVQPGFAHCVVGLRLGREVGAEAARGLLGVVGAHAGDDHVAADARVLGRLDQADGAAQVHRALALGAAAGPGAGREHDRIGAGDRRAELDVGLEVGQHGLGPGRADVLEVVGVADEPADVVTPGREQALESQRDLTVAAADDDVHVRPPSARARSSAWSTTACRARAPARHRRPRCRRAR